MDLFDVLFEFHDNVLRKIAETFSEQIQSALVFRIFFDAEFQPQMVGRIGKKIFDRNAVADRLVVQKATFRSDRKRVQQTVLCCVEGPECGGIIPRPPSEIPGAGKGCNFLFV